MVTGFGSTASVMCCSLSQLVLDNEILAMIRKAKRGFEFDEDILGFEALDYVVNDHETFLEQEHTIEYLQKNEIFVPSIGFDSVWADWIKCGETPLNERAADRALDLIEKDELVPQDAAITAEVEKILAAAEKELL